MPTILAKENIISKYTISVFKININNKLEKKDLLNNLWKYMIKSEKKEKENLSTNIDKILYVK